MSADARCARHDPPPRRFSLRWFACSRDAPVTLAPATTTDLGIAAADDGRAPAPATKFRSFLRRPLVMLIVINLYQDIAAQYRSNLGDTPV
jgi:hypothetical protein